MGNEKYHVNLFDDCIISIYVTRSVSYKHIKNFHMFMLTSQSGYLNLVFQIDRFSGPSAPANSDLSLTFTNFSRGGGGEWNPRPPGFSLVIATNINQSTPNFLTC